MANFKLSFSGFDEIMAAVSEFAVNDGDKSHMQEVGDKMAGEMRSGYLQAGNVDTGLLTDPRITHSWIKDGDNGGLAMYTGVIKWDAVMAQYGKDPKKDIPPNIAAYWIEYGVEPHLTHKGFRLKAKGASETMAAAIRSGVKIHPGIKANPIISKTFYSNQDDILMGVSRYIDSKLDKAFK